VEQSNIGWEMPRHQLSLETMDMFQESKVHQNLNLSMEESIDY
jgi:hypothetical protein